MVSAAAQVANFLRGFSSYDGELPPALDLESGILVESEPARTEAETVSDIRVWLQQIERTTQRTPIIYAGHRAMIRYFRSKRPFDEKYALWVAEYSDSPKPHVPGAWLPWLLWQHSDTGEVSGIFGRVDISLIRDGDLRRLVGKVHASAPSD